MKLSMLTLLHHLADWARTSPHMIAQRYRKNDDYVDLSAREYCDRVFALALFLEAQGFGKEDISAIFSYNCPEWVHMDLAPLLLGAKSVGIYPNANAHEVAFILDNTKAKVLCVQNGDYYRRLVGAEGGLPEHVSLVIVFDGDTSVSPKAVAYEAALAEGRKRLHDKKIDDYLNRLDPHAPAFLIYTSGTTGNPKGAMLSHDNFVFTAEAVMGFWKLRRYEGEMFSFLPLCHVAEKLQNVAVGLVARHTITFCTAFDNVAKELVLAQPTLLLCVPRVWEKMVEGVEAKLAEARGARKRLARWALKVGARVAEYRYAGRAVPLRLRARRRLADKLVLEKIRQNLGVARVETAASGAAKLAEHVTKWFRAIDIEILEDFGQTESTGVICMTPPGQDAHGSVGVPVTGMEVRLADDGEILTRGRHVFKGYYKNPEATAQVLVGGWLYTGDTGEVTSDGFIRILGRKKEVLKTSGGKMIAPLPIEEKLKAAKGVSQVVVVGDGRKYLSALLTVTGDLAAAESGADGEVITDPQVLKRVQGEIDAVNKELASYERIKNFTVLAREFTVESGEMTPTLKMKRNVIEQRYRHLIDKMYAPGA